jgi:hypothetical protein
VEPDGSASQFVVIFPELGLLILPKRQRGMATADRVLPAVQQGSSRLGQVTEEFDRGHAELRASVSTVCFRQMRDADATTATRA